MSQSTPTNNLPPAVRHITAINPTSGKSIFQTEESAHPPTESLPGTDYTLEYLTSENPINVKDNADVTAYNTAVTSPPAPLSIVHRIPGGTVLRRIDKAPGAVSPMHRTTTLDYIIILEGEIECILDSGEKRLLRRGDTLIQRGTMHAWRNTSKTEWSRMLCIMMPVEGLEFDGKVLEDEFLAPPKVDDH